MPGLSTADQRNGPALGFDIPRRLSLTVTAGKVRYKSEVAAHRQFGHRYRLRLTVVGRRAVDRLHCKLNVWRPTSDGGPRCKIYNSLRPGDGELPHRMGVRPVNVERAVNDADLVTKHKLGSNAAQVVADKRVPGKRLNRSLARKLKLLALPCLKAGKQVDPVIDGYERELEYAVTEVAALMLRNVAIWKADEDPAALLAAGEILYDDV